MTSKIVQIISDDQIIDLDQFASPDTALTTLPSSAMTPKQLQHADALLIRSVSNVNAALLNNTNIRFIGTPTAGIDHLDTKYLHSRNITWANAPGCNAKAVADYVLMAIAHLHDDERLQSMRGKVGVIGVGHVGSLVSALLKQIGFIVLENDPPRADHDPTFHSTPLNELYDCDLICLHTPLTTRGQHPTHHLINHAFLSRFNPDGIIINAGRGAVINPQVLKQFSHLTTILDVWENEPDIDPTVVESAYLATPHIAGYSQLAKSRATRQIYKAFSQHFQIDFQPRQNNNHACEISIDLSKPNWHKKVIETTPLTSLSHAFKTALQQTDTPKKTFKNIRKHYPLRKEFIINH